MNSQGRGGQGDSGLSLRFDSFVFDLWRFPASWRFSFPSPMVPPMATESAHRTQSRAAYNISRVQSRQDQARLRSWIMTNITNLQLRTLLEKHLTPEQDLHISSQSSQQILTAQFNPAKPQHILPVLTLANQCESSPCSKTGQNRQNQCFKRHFVTLSLCHFAVEFVEFTAVCNLSDFQTYPLPGTQNSVKPKTSWVFLGFPLGVKDGKGTHRKCRLAILESWRPVAKFANLGDEEQVK